ncbi:MAG: SEC-C metal-binding domain-containing protein, partial [Pseudomonadota bacterium]
DVMNDQRKAIFEQRIEFMSAEDVADIVSDMRVTLLDDMVQTYIPPKSYAERWDVDGLKEEVKEVFNLDLAIDKWAAEEGVADTEIFERVDEATRTAYEKRCDDFGEETSRRIEKAILLQTIDTDWREHLQMLDHLRSVVGLRGMGQRDPLHEFKTEAFALFSTLLDGLRRDVTRSLYHVQVQRQEDRQSQIDVEQAKRLLQELQAKGQLDPSKMRAEHIDATTGQNDAGHGGPEAPQRGYGQSAGVATLKAQRVNRDVDPNDPSTWHKVSRNAPCPCGSGKKYKHCHGDPRKQPQAI